jgi:hypothetical protein
MEKELKRLLIMYSVSKRAPCPSPETVFKLKIKGIARKKIKKQCLLIILRFNSHFRPQLKIQLCSPSITQA